MSIELNKLINSRYVITRYVASGGMAEIYEALDVVVNKTVALKFIKDKYLENKDALEQFKNEARFTAMFDHPNIMKIYNVGEYDGCQFLSYELLKGRTLKQVLDNRGKLSLDECLDYMSQILSATNLIHFQGILHNDLKPDNMCLLADGTIKVVDFGAATHASNKTEKHILGTANYLAPEVIMNKKYSVQSDIYSLGIILYELLTGELPYQGRNSQEVLEAHTSGSNISIKGLVTLPNSDDIDYVVNKAISKNLSYRYKTDKEFMSDIKKLKNHESFKKEGFFKRIFSK